MKKLVTFCLKNGLVALLMVLSQAVFSVNYFWVGGTGNWSDVTHWSLSSGGAFPSADHATPPTITDVVTFDANSFSVPGQVVTVDIDGTAESLTFTGITDNPTFTGTAARTITVAGNLTLDNTVMYTYAGLYTMTGASGAGPFSITSNGAVLAVGGSFGVLINAAGVEYDLADALVVDQLGLQAGTLDLNGSAVTCSVLDASILTDDVRTLDFSGSKVTVIGTGATPVVDFRSVAGNLTITDPGGTSELELTNAGQVVLELGRNSLTIPELDFTASTNIDIETKASEDNTVTITFNEITCAGAAGAFDIDNAGNRGSRKVFSGAVNLGDDRTYNIFCADGTAFGTASSEFSSTFTVGSNGNGDISGDFVEFKGAVDLGASNECEFSDEVQFESTFTVASTSGNHIECLADSDWDGAVAINGNTTITLSGTTTFDNNNDVTIAAAAAVVMNNGATTPTVTTDGNWLLGAGSSLAIGNGSDGAWTFTATSSEIDVPAAGATINVNTGASTCSLDQLDINGNSTITLASNTNITGAVDVATGVTASFTNSGTPTVGVSGSWLLNGNSTTNIGNGSDGAWTFSAGTVTLSGTSSLVANANTSTVSFNNLNLGTGTTLQLGTGAATDAAVTGIFTSIGTCSSGATMKSITGGVSATLDLPGAEAVSGLVVQDINVTTSTLTVTDGANVSNNTGTITFNRSTGTTLFWVGGMVTNTNIGTYATAGDDDWSNPDNWSVTSGTYTQENKCIPTISTPVVFDAASFDAAGRLDINVDVDGDAESINFNGVDEAATFSGLAARTVNIAGALTLDNTMTYPFAGTYNMTGASGAGPFAITSNGASLAAGDLLIDALGVEYDIADALTIDQLGLDAGTLDLDAAVSCTNLDANIAVGDAVRVIDFSTTSKVTVTGSGATEVVDFQSAGGNLTLNNTGGTAELEFSNAGQVVLELGANTLSVPLLDFTNSTNVDITTAGAGDPTNTMTINGLTMTGATGTLDIDNGGVGLRKVFSGAVSLGDDRTYNIFCADGTAFGTASSEFSSGFTVGSNGNGDISGDFVEFKGAVDLGASNECEFSDEVQFESTFTVASTSGNHIECLADSDWDGAVDINGNATFILTGTVDISGAVDVATGATVSFTNSGTPTVGVSGNWTLNGNSTTNIGNGSDGAWTFSAGTVTLGGTSILTSNANTSTVSFNDITLGDGTTWNIGTAAATDAVVTGVLSAAGDCSSGATMKSITGGVSATLDLPGAEAVSGLVVQDINVTTSTLTVTDGANVSNNTGTITFTNSGGTTLFWVGGMVANTNTGTFATAGDDDWNNPDNWSLTTNTYSGTNRCIPTITTPVVFDASSFGAAGRMDINVNVDASAASMTFAGVDEAATFSGLAARTVNIAGALTLDNTMTYPFAGTYNMTGVSGAGPFAITSNGASLATGDLLIDALGVEYDIADALTIDQLGLDAGTLDLDAVVSCTNLDANIAVGDAVRVIDFSTTSKVTVTGSGATEVVDFQSAGGNLTLNNTGGTAELEFSNAGQVVLELGTNTLSVPLLDFTNSTNVDITTAGAGDPTNTMTINGLTMTGATGTLDIDNGGVGLRKVFSGAVSMGSNRTYNIFCADGTAFGTASSEFSSTFTAGANGNGDISGDFVEFKGAVNLSTNNECEFSDEVQFESTFTVASTTGNAIVCQDDSDWDGTITINGNARFTLSNTTTIDGDVNIAAGASVAMTNGASTPTVTATGNWSLAAAAILDLGEGVDGAWTFNSTSIMSFANNTTLNVNTGSSTTTLDQLDINATTTATFDLDANTTITGAVDIIAAGTAVFNCSSTPTVSVTGDWTVNAGALADIGNATTGNWTFSTSTVSMAANSNFDFFTVNAGTLDNITVTGDGAQVRIGTNTTITGDVNIGAGFGATFVNALNPTISATGDWNIGAGSTLDLGNAANGAWTFTTSTVDMADGATMYVRNGSSATSFNNLTMNGNDSLELPITAGTSVTGAFTTVSSCSAQNVIVSSTPGSRASLSLAAAESENYLRVKDVNVLTSNLTVDRGSDDGNNLGITFNNTLAATLYWVGDVSGGNPKTGTFSTGVNNNWSNPDNWSPTDGVYPGTNGCIPTVEDLVNFNANSFSNGGEVVTVDEDAYAGTLDFTGVTNTPTFTGAGNIAIQIDGALTMAAAMTCTFGGTINFTGAYAAGPFNVTSNGQTIARTALFNSTVADYALADAFTITGELGLEDGNLDLGAGNTVTCDSLNVNMGTGNAGKTFNYNGATINITGGGVSSGTNQIVLDLRHANNTNLTFTGQAGALINFTGNVDDVLLHLGRRPKTVPNLTFTGTNDEVIIHTIYNQNNAGQLITIGDITVIKDGVTLNLDRNPNGGRFGNRKNIGVVTVPDDCTVDIRCPNSTGFGAGTISTIDAFSVGDNVEGDLRGDYIDITNNSTFGDRTSFQFIDPVRFLSDLTIGSTENEHFDLRHLAFINGELTANSASTTMYLRHNTQFQNISVPAGNVLTIDQESTRDHVVTGTMTIGDGAAFEILLGRSQWDVQGNVTVGNGGRFEIDNGNDYFDFEGDLTLQPNSVLVISQTNNTFIRGTLTANGSCSEYITFRSTSSGNTAPLRLTSAQVVSGVVARDIRNNAAGLTINGGQNAGNNTGITFVAAITGDDFYWVGGVTTDPDGAGPLTAGGLDNLWSTVQNWSTTSGGYDGQACVPGQLDNVFFDAASFDGTPANLDVEVDVANVTVNDMDWTGQDDAVDFDPTSTSTARTINVFGNFTLDADMTNNFEGTFRFDNDGNGWGTRNTLTFNTVSFIGPIVFDKQVSTVWLLADALDINGGENADLTIERGCMFPQGNTISLEDDLVLENGGRINWVHNGGYVVQTTPYTIEFDGQDDNVGMQQLNVYDNEGANGDARIYNLVVNRQSNGTADNNTVEVVRRTGLNGSITIHGDLDIQRGNLYISGNYKLNGQAANNFDMAAGTFLSIEDNGDGFPGGFVNANINFEESSTTRFMRNGAQNVSATPTYANLSMLTGGTKTLLGATTMKSDLLIAENVTLFDSGNQLTGDDDGTADDTFTMENDATFTIGEAGGNTNFPTGFTNFNIDNSLGAEALIEYDGDGAQNVGAISGAGNSAYALVEFNRGGTKTTTGNFDVNTSLTIANGVTLANGGAHTITFDVGNGNSNWIANGTGTYTPSATSTVVFNGTAHDVNRGTVAAVFNNMTVQNGCIVTLSDDLEVQDRLTLTNGIVNTGARTLNCTSTDAADIAGYSNASFVNGNLRKAIATNTSTYGLPIGNGTASTDYYLAEFVNNNITGVTALDVSVAPITETAPNNDATINPALVQDGTPIIDIVADAQWTIDEVGARTGGDYGIRLYLENLPNVSAADDNYICPVKRASTSTTYADWDTFDGSTTIPADGAAGRIYAGGAGYVERLGYTDFSFHAVAKGMFVLPVELVHFDAILNGDKVDITWQTATEINNDYFTVERSKDGTKWKDVIETDGAGDSHTIIDYFEVDYDPIEGISYYRLRQTDEDGSISYSNVVAVLNKQSGSSESGDISIFPNPINPGQNMSLQFNDISGQEVLVVIRDIQGREYYSKVVMDVEDGRLIAIPIEENIAKGIYLIKASSNDVVYNKQLIIR